MICTRKAVAGAVALLMTVTLATPARAAEDTEPPPTPSGLTARAVGVAGDPLADAPLTFDAEANSLAALSASQGANTPLIAAYSGQRGLRVAATKAPGYVTWSRSAVGQQPYLAARFRVRVISHGAGESVDLFTVTNGQRVRNFDFFVTGDTRRFKWDLWQSNAGEADFLVQYGRWYTVEVRVSFAGETHWASVAIDGVDYGTITSPWVDTTVRSVILGAYTAKTHIQHYDDIAIATSPTPFPDPAPAAVELRWDPVVDAGSGLSGYSIWRNGQWYGWTKAGTTIFVDRAPVAGATYRVRAIDRANNRSPWSPTVGVPG